MNRQRNTSDIWPDMNIGKNKLKIYCICFKITIISIRVGIESIQGNEVNPYLAATQVKKPVAAPIQEEPMATTPIAQSDSDSDSN